VSPILAFGTLGALVGWTLRFAVRRLERGKTTSAVEA
jgi:hypothetical protein